MSLGYNEPASDEVIIDIVKLLLDYDDTFSDRVSPLLRKELIEYLHKPKAEQSHFFPD